MRHCTVRCQHCDINYSYQASGEGCHEPTNDKDYCPECKQAIIDALAKIPKKFGKSTMKIGVPPEYIFHLKEKREAEKDPKGLHMKRVFACLYDWENGEHEVVGDVNGDGNTPHFFYHYWPSEPEEMSVTLEVEKDLKTNEVIGYWGNDVNQQIRGITLPEIPEFSEEERTRLIELHRVPLDPNYDPEKKNTFTTEMRDDLSKFSGLYYLDYKYDDKKIDTNDE